MNPELPNDPRKALEPSMTALLLGELPEDQARFMRQAIATDPELANTFEALKQTIELVRQTQIDPTEGTKTQQVPLKLNEERRQELLRRFRTLEPVEFRKDVQSRVGWLIPAAAAAVVLVVASLALIPARTKDRTRLLVRQMPRDSERPELPGVTSEPTAGRSASVSL